MSGHSKWATIKRIRRACRRQARQDLHPPHQGNHHRRQDRRWRPRRQSPPPHPAIAAAKRKTCRRWRIKRAIQRGTGELREGVSYEKRSPTRAMAPAGSHHRRRPHRQQEPRCQRDTPRLQQERWQQPRRRRRSRLDVHQGVVVIAKDAASEEDHRSRPRRRSRRPRG